MCGDRIGDLTKQKNALLARPARVARAGLANRASHRLTRIVLASGLGESDRLSVALGGSVGRQGRFG